MHFLPLRVGRTRVTSLALLALLTVSVGTALSARPPVPSGGRVLAPGYVPQVCTAADAGTSLSGYYYSTNSNSWVSAPYCFGLWGNLTASPAQVTRPGAAVTIRAIPDTNSSVYAPQTNSISWSYGAAKLVSGCGPSDLACTVIPAEHATSEWQWVEFHVSMPRIFFVDSPGSNCAGLHLCPGFTTNAWSFAGVPPQSRVCAPNCNALAIEFDPTIDSGSSIVPVEGTCGAAPACSTSLTLKTNPGALTIQQQIEEDALRKQAGRWKTMQDLQRQIFDTTMDATKNPTVERRTNTFDGYIHASTDPKNAVALQAADGDLAVMFPAATTASRAVSSELRGAQVVPAMPSTTLILRALYKAQPSKAALKALADATTLATQPTSSPERARARLALAIGLAYGRRVLAHELGVKLNIKRKGAPIVLGSTKATVKPGQHKTLAVRLTPLGRRVLRIIDLARAGGPASVTLVVNVTHGGKKSHASRSLVVR